MDLFQEKPSRTACGLLALLIALQPAAPLFAAERAVPVQLPAAAFGLAKAPAISEFIVSPANLTVADKPQDVAAIIDELRAIKDPAERNRVWLARTQIDPMELRLAERGKPMSRADIDALAARLPGVLKAHLLETLARHDYEKLSFDGADSYRVKDGLAFWADFATPADAEKRIAAQVLLQSPARHRLSKDPTYSLIAALTSAPMAMSRVLDGKRMTPDEWEAVARVADQNGLSLARFGRYAIAGSGAGFHLTNDVLIAARGVNDPGLARKLQRVLTFLAGHGIDIITDENVGAAAFFNPMEGQLAYVMPSRAGLNAFSHESTHARFHELEKQVKSWANRKLAIPYAVDGPFVSPVANFGGFMNLLNELNSWRTGESFDGGKSDEEILKILRDSYGLQAGAAAAALFSSLWPASRVAGVPVPRLILRAVRRLNALGDEDFAALAQRADEPSQMDFLRLLYARYGGGAAAPAALADSTRRLAESGASESVRGIAKRLLSATGEQEPPEAAKAADLRAYRLAAGRWIESFESEKVKVIPAQLHFLSAATIRFADENKLFDYDQTIGRMRARWGALVSADEDDRALFAQIAAAPGNSWNEKIADYLARYNETGFETLWAELPRKPTFNLRQLLVEKHKDDFKPEHVRQLARWAVETGTPPELQAAAAALLADLMEALGLPALFAPDDLKVLQDIQRSENQKAGRPIDAYVPFGRAPDPDHWLLSAIDEVLAPAMFDGKPGIFRLKAIETITQRTYPEELPRLRARLIQVIADPKIDRYDQWVARMFLIPAANQLFHTHVAWGEAVAQTVLADPAANATALEFVGEFYRLGLGATFRGPAWGKWVGHLDSDARSQAEQAVARLSPDQRARYDRALDELWRLLGNSDPKVRAAALYATAFRPVFLVGLEGRLAGSMRGGPSPYRAAAVKLAGMMRPEFSPALDAALAGLSPTEEERPLLAPRLAPAGN